MKGVTLMKRTGKYRAQIYFNKQTIFLGYFKTEAEAEAAYNRAARKYAVDEDYYPIDGAYEMAFKRR
jgi:hypothetical protein